MIHNLYFVLGQRVNPKCLKGSKVTVSVNKANKKKQHLCNTHFTELCKYRIIPVDLPEIHKAQNIF